MGYLFAEISDKAAAHLRCKNKNNPGKWETRDQSELTWSHRETVIYAYIDRPQKPGKVTIQLRPCATVFLPYSKFLPIYSIVGKWKENRKLFTFLNDAIDLRKHGIKKEIQQLKANCTFMLRYLDQFITIENQFKIWSS